jgi:hypothetical protein
LRGRAPTSCSTTGRSTGGPRTHIAGAPGDHNLLKGDWLLYSKMVDGKLQYEGLFEAIE